MGSIKPGGDVLVFLREADALRDPRLRINPLTIDQCVRQTETIRRVPICAELGLVVLDDANDSNPYCLITLGPAAGMVVHFRHDDEPELRYPSLAAFAHALREAHRDELIIDNLPRSPLDPHPDQTLLAGVLQSYLRRDDDSAANLLHLLYPLLAPTNQDVVDETARHDDFLVREVAARFIERHPLAGHRELARRLASDAWSQVSQPARRALRAMAAPR